MSDYYSNEIDDGHGPHGEDLGGGWQNAEHWLAHQKDRPLHLLKQQPWARHVDMERTRNRAVNCGRKWMGASRLESAAPHSGSPGRKISSTARWTFCWGPMMDWKGVEAQHQNAKWVKATCWWVFKLLNSGPTCSSLTTVIFNLDFYVTWGSWSIYAK